MIFAVNQLLFGQHEYAVPAVIKLQPGERNIRILFHQMYHAVAYFTNQHAVIAQEVWRTGQNAAHQLQAVAACGQAQFRLKAELLRQVGHIFRIDIRRVGDDQIVLDRGDVTEQIGADRDHLMFHAVRLNITLGHGQHVGGDIYRVHFRFREGIAAGDSDTATAGTHIQDMTRRMGDQRAEAIVDQLTNR
ncbi:hypothetical protein D3C76_1295700 [compost metagenome]